MVTYTTLISTEQLADALAQRQDLLVFDCRFRLSDPSAGRNAYTQSHIPGALYADLEQVLSGPVRPDTGRHPLPDIDVWRDWVQACGIEPSKQVVVYDDSFGSMAARMWWMLRWIGHDKVALLDGGWTAWMRENKPVTAEVPKTHPVPTRYTNAPRQELLFSTQQVQEHLKHGGALIDARSEARFLALEEPFDKVAGHIPDAVNIPFEDNLDLDGTFLNAEDIREVYAEQISGDSGEDVVIMCGSGVTACHSLIALEHAGIKGAKLYAGSWSEWILDPKRPVVGK